MENIYGKSLAELQIELNEARAKLTEQKIEMAATKNYIERIRFEIENVRKKKENDKARVLQILVDTNFNIVKAERRISLVCQSMIPTPTLYRYRKKLMNMNPTLFPSDGDWLTFANQYFPEMRGRPHSKATDEKKHLLLSVLNKVQSPITLADLLALCNSNSSLSAPLTESSLRRYLTDAIGLYYGCFYYSSGHTIEIQLSVFHSNPNFDSGMIYFVSKVSKMPLLIFPVKGKISKSKFCELVLLLIEFYSAKAKPSAHDYDFCLYIESLNKSQDVVKLIKEKCSKCVEVHFI